MYPAIVEELGFQANATLCCGAAVPLPVRTWVADELEALLAKVALAEATPLA